MPQEQLDPQVVNLAKAIRQTESGGNFGAKGKSGEFGAYQYTPATWAKDSANAGVNVSLDQATPQQQNEVAYKKLKALKDRGLNVGQIASSWNAGEGEPDAYKGTFSNGKPSTGKNNYGVQFDVPAYAKSVAMAYQTLKSGGQVNVDPKNPSSVAIPSFNPTPYSKPNPGSVDFSGSNKDVSQVTSPENPDDIATKLTGRLAEGSEAVNDTAQRALKGDALGTASGILRTVGSGAGAVGDITNSLIENTPVVGTAVKAIEGLLGKGVGALASTPTGQSVVKAIGDFTTKHPELAKDMGAGFNILTAIPIFKGLSAVKNVALDATATALKGIAEKSATADLTKVVSSTKTGIRDLASNPDSIKTLIDERAIPDIEDGKFTTQEASSKLDHAINQIEDNELQPALDRAETSARSALAKNKDRFSFDAILQRAEKIATDSQEDFGPIKKELELVRKRFGDFPTLKQINDAKRVVARKISQASYGSLDSSAMKVARETLQTTVEDGAKALGLDDVGAINQKMARLIKAQKILKHIDGKRVKLGKVGGLIQDVATAGGEMLGNASQIPIAGAFLGREAGGFVGKKFAKISGGLLSRTGKDAIRTPIKTASKNAVKGLISSRAQNATRSR